MSRKNSNCCTVLPHLWRTHSCVPRSHSCERQDFIADVRTRPRIILDLSIPIQPSPGFVSMYLAILIPLSSRFLPSDRRTRAAKIAHQYDSGAWLASRAVTPFNDFSKQLGEINGKQKYMDVISHHDKRPEPIVSQALDREKAIRLPAWRLPRCRK